MSIDSIVRTCNKQAMAHLCSNSYSECYRLLKRAEEIIKSPNYPTSSKLIAVTLNNLGCYYKRINSYDLALEYLESSLIQDKDADASTKAGTHLNISSVLSQKRNHQQALTHSLEALQLLSQSNDFRTRIIALKSIGDEYSALECTDKARSAYNTALELSQKYLGDPHELTLALYQKSRASSRPEKKFYFEKLNKRATRQFFNNFNPALPKVFPMRASKSFDRSPPPKQKLIRNDPIYSQTSHKRKPFSQPIDLSGNTEKVVVYSKLEKKINGLQSQLEDFERRYKHLEAFTRKKRRTRREKKTLEESVVIIQRWWRGYRGRKEFKNYQRKKTHERAKRAIEELEILRKEAIDEELFTEEPRPKTNTAKQTRYAMKRNIGTAYRGNLFNQ